MSVLNARDRLGTSNSVTWKERNQFLNPGSCDGRALGMNLTKLAGRIPGLWDKTPQVTTVGAPGSSPVASKAGKGGPCN